MIYGVFILTLITFIYCVTIVWIIYGFNKIKTTKDIDRAVKPFKVSVIVPFRDEEENLHNCLSSIQNQNFDNNSYEIILVDDNSTDKSISIVKDFITSSECTIHLIHLINKTSKKEALKKGVELAVNKIIVTTDADCILPINWLNSIVSQFNEDKDMLLGPVIFRENPGFLSAFQSLDMFAIQGVEFGSLGFNKPILNNAANLSYTYNSFSKVGGFDSLDTPSGDDIFLLEKFKSRNLKIGGFLSNDFVVETQSEKSWSSLFNQRVRWSSKSKFYKDKFLLFISGLILTQNILLLFVYLGILFVENHRLTFIFLLLTKWLIDFILLFLVASFFKRKSSLFYFIPVQLIYPIYIIIIWIASVSLKFEWKGRKY